MFVIFNNNDLDELNSNKQNKLTPIDTLYHGVVRDTSGFGCNIFVPVEQYIINNYTISCINYDLEGRFNKTDIQSLDTAPNGVRIYTATLSNDTNHEYAGCAVMVYLLFSPHN